MPRTAPRAAIPPKTARTDTPSEAVEGLLADRDGFQAHIWSAAALGIPVPLFHHS